MNASQVGRAGQLDTNNHTGAGDGHMQNAPAATQQTFQQLLQQMIEMLVVEETSALSTLDETSAFSALGTVNAGMTSPLLTPSLNASLSTLLPLLPNFQGASLTGASDPFAAPNLYAQNAQPTVGATQRSARSVEPYVQAASTKYHLPANLLNAVIEQESGYQQNAVSSQGALGLMQLMPATAQTLGVSNPFDPAQNIDGGAHYLRQLLDKFNGSVPLALAAYNAGPAAVQQHGGIPPYPETQAYVADILQKVGQSS